MPIKIMLDLTVDERGVKMTSKGQPQKMNELEQKVAAALMGVIKGFAQEAANQIAAAMQAKATAEEILSLKGAEVSEEAGIEHIKKSFVEHLEAKERGATIIDPKTGKLAEVAPTEDNVVKFPSSNGTESAIQ